MKKTIALLIAVILTVGLLTACTESEMEDIFSALGLEDVLRGDASSQEFSSSAASVVPEQSTSLPVSSTISQPAPASVTLNQDVMAFIGLSNGKVMEINGSNAHNYIMYGGSPVADYTTSAVAYPVEFWFSCSQDEMMQVLDIYSDGHGNTPDGNIWPEHFPVYAIGAFADTVYNVLEYDGKITYDILSHATGLTPQLDYCAANEGINYSYEFDSWSTVFLIEGYTMNTVFREENDERVLYEVLVYLE